ncbi:hypothetical protein ACQEVB_38825 [Pseudonocardia sp. CA-107938]|uniref:hypothetical protein n=1 Tax=Pseudonocardia sp. CA-107938 TaxID=3240021 RepID=UPI003D8D7200
MDSDAGVVVAVSYWDRPIQSSAPNLTRVRERIKAAAGGDLVAESYAVAWQEPGLAPAWPGATVRIDRMQIDPATALAEQELIRTHLMQETVFDKAFRGAELMIDHGTGATLLATTWTSAPAATRAHAVVAQLRHTGGGTTITLQRTETYVLVRGCGPITTPERVERRVGTDRPQVREARVDGSDDGCETTVGAQLR